MQIIYKYRMQSIGAVCIQIIVLSMWIGHVIGSSPNLLIDYNLILARVNKQYDKISKLEQMALNSNVENSNPGINVEDKCILDNIYYKSLNCPHPYTIIEKVPEAQKKEISTAYDDMTRMGNVYILQSKSLEDINKEFSRCLLEYKKALSDTKNLINSVAMEARLHMADLEEITNNSITEKFSENDVTNALLFTKNIKYIYNPQINVLKNLLIKIENGESQYIEESLNLLYIFRDSTDLYISCLHYIYMFTKICDKFYVIEDILIKFSPYESCLKKKIELLQELIKIDHKKTCNKELSKFILIKLRKTMIKYKTLFRIFSSE
ncbi:hypothetical protein NEPAR07_0930 [Nematocida parisii]|uniref:Uncharacterized protein n=1 Tax=Nematocida parisii (strain ERTm3) TaxID=935791 RepID=I3EDN9_NEMP3|nr:hypothetical protein NEQG_02459 [Nematocida parisii ERTm3]KAI5143881.1 hypothetical protein NEPAR07_0930 [Nematocida parisii]